MKFSAITLYLEYKVDPRLFAVWYSRTVCPHVDVLKTFERKSSLGNLNICVMLLDPLLAGVCKAADPGTSTVLLCVNWLNS